MKGVISMIKSTLRTESPADTEFADGKPDLGDADAQGGDGPNAALYECPSCGSVLIEPASDECSQCPSDSLVEV
jgi:hypothetical protein